MDINTITKNAIAYHEAAHAIFAHSMSIDVVKLTVVPDSGSEGGCEVDLAEYFYRNLKRMREATIGLVRFHLAGQIAQRKYLEEKGIDTTAVLKNAAAYDNAQVEHYIDTNNRNGETEIDINQQIAAVSEVLNVAGFWESTKRLANILVEEDELVGERLSQVLDSLDLDAL